MTPQREKTTQKTKEKSKALRRERGPGAAPLVSCLLQNSELQSKEIGFVVRKSHHVLQPPRREKPSHATVSRMTALGAARGLTEIRPRSARDLQGPPQAKRACRRRNGVWGVPTFAIVKTALFPSRFPLHSGLPDICPIFVCNQPPLSYSQLAAQDLVCARVCVCLRV